jgi:hypothetical protein
MEPGNERGNQQPTGLVTSRQWPTLVDRVLANREVGVFIQNHFDTYPGLDWRVFVYTLPNHVARVLIREPSGSSAH